MKSSKQVWRKIISPHLLIVLLITFASCGKDSTKKNIVDDNTSATNWNNPGQYNTPIYHNPDVPSNVQNTINQLKSSVACVSGSDGVATYTGRRLTQNISFGLNGQPTNGNSSTVSYVGALNAGPVTGGTQVELFTGISVFGDLLFVTKHSSGTSVLGFTYTISFCESQITMNGWGGSTTLPLISDSNQVTQLTSDSYTVLDFQSCQGSGMVDSSTLTAYFTPSSTSSYSGTPYGSYGGMLPFQTTFFPLSECNSGYYY